MEENGNKQGSVAYARRETSQMTTRTEGLRAVLWTRVSTREQTTEIQLPKLRAAAKERGYRVVRHFNLPGVSAYRQENQYKKAINQLYKAAKSGAFDVVLVTALDRITRKGGESLVTILETLDAYGVSVISLREGFTEHKADDKWGRFVQKMLIEFIGILGEEESDKISERTIDGHKTARAKGVTLGRPVVRDGVDVEMVLALRAEGLSWRKVHAAHLETRNAKGKKVKPSVTTIRRAVADYEREGGVMYGTHRSTKRVRVRHS